MQGRSSFAKSSLSVTLGVTRGVTLSVTLAVLLSGCTVTDMLGSAVEEEQPQRVTAAFVQAQDPQAPIGEAEHPAVVKANGGAYEDEKLEALLAVVVAELVAAEPAEDGKPGHAYRVTILDSGTVNAFALPGGYLYVTRGLIALANDASEIAAVLAHEMAHVDASHGIQRSQATKATDIAARVASEVVTDGATGALAKASSGRKLASFSQRQELEADHLGIRRAGRAGFDPHAAERFLKQMRRWASYRGSLGGGGSNRGGGGDMLSTHPSTPERVTLARAHAERSGLGDTGLSLRERYLEGVDGLVFGDRADQGFVRGQLYSDKALGVGFAVPRGFALRNRAGAALATGPNEMAVRFDAVPRDKTPGLSPREYIASGWVNGIDSGSIQTAERSGMSLATAKAQAGAFDFAVAVFADDTHYYRFITAAPKGASGLARVSRSVSGSFERLSKAKLAALKPLRLRVVSVREGEDVAALAARMASGGKELFRTLNALDDGAGLAAGDRVKIVSAD